MRNKSVELISGAQKGLWGLFEKSITVSWIADEGDEAAQPEIAKDIEIVLAELQNLNSKHLLHPEGAVSHVVTQGKIQGGEGAPEGWRLLLAQSMLKWSEKQL
jgi:hypothetical protein